MKRALHSGARPRVAPLLCLMSALAGPSLARAETETIRIEYRAAPPCPSEAQFVAEVGKRTTRARLATAPSDVRTFIVLIEQKRGRVSGSLVIREREQTTVARTVEGEQCKDVSSALALATALAIDPNASLSGGANAAESPREAPPKSDTAPVDASATGHSETPRPAKSAPQPSDTTQPNARPPRLDARPLRFEVAAGPSLLVGAAPRVAFGASAWLGASSTSHSWLVRFGADLSWLEAPTQTVASASSTFRFVYLRPTLCAFDLSRHPSLSLAPCIALPLGAVTGRGTNITNTATETRFWGSLNALLRLNVALGRRWFFEGDAALVLPLTRYRFVFQNPDTTIYRVPSVAFDGELRLGARF